LSAWVFLLVSNTFNYEVANCNSLKLLQDLVVRALPPTTAALPWCAATACGASRRRTSASTNGSWSKCSRRISSKVKRCCWTCTTKALRPIWSPPRHSAVVSLQRVASAATPSRAARHCPLMIYCLPSENSSRWENWNFQTRPKLIIFIVVMAFCY